MNGATMAFFRRLAAATVTINAASMGLAYLTDNPRVFAVSYVGAGLTGYGWLYIADEERRVAKAGFRSIAMRLRWEIKEEGHQPGQLLPSIREYAQRFGTTRITVRRALAQLADEGLVEILPGKGTYVRDQTIDHGVRADRRTDWVECTLRQWVRHRQVIEPAESLAAGLAVSTSTVRRVIRRMVNDGTLRQLPDGRYERS